MEEYDNNQNTNNKKISPFLTTPSLMLLLTGSANYFIKDPELNKYLANYVAPFIASVIAYGAQYISAIFFFSPDEFAINKRLKRDEKILIRQLEEANEKPFLYTPEHLAEIREDLADTRRQLRRIGRSSL
jgi:hypothetical protein